MIDHVSAMAVLPKHSNPVPASEANFNTAGLNVSDAYLSDLLSFSLERLNKEPDLLRADAERVRRQMQDVAVGHYQAFITAADAVHSIRSEISSIDRHLGSLIAELPRLTSGCNEFMEEAQSIMEKRRLNKTLLANHPMLMDLLEIPQLMDTCVRNGNYDEALDLEAFVTKLATMHSKLPVVQSLAEEVRQTTRSMLLQLLQRLRSNIQLPECLRVIGYLRRLSVLSEYDMRLQFLRCREAWLADIIGDLDQSSPYEFLKRTVDVHRVHLFDVVTQYRAIFSDDSSSSDFHLFHASFDSDALSGSAPSSTGGSDGGLLFTWAMHRVFAFLSSLSSHLPFISDGASLASVLEHCMYCGMSLGRVGLDLRGLLPPLFESCISEMFRNNIGNAVKTFEHSLDVHRWLPLPSIPLASSNRFSSRTEAIDDVSPPYSLMEHAPLATFVNGVLGALNELRHCAPLSLKAELAGELEKGLSSVCEALLRYHHSRLAHTTNTTLFLAMCTAFVDVVCPYCSHCFSRCYGCSANIVHTHSLLEPLKRLLAEKAVTRDNSDGAVGETEPEEADQNSEDDEGLKAGAAGISEAIESTASGVAQNGGNGHIEEGSTSSS